MNIIIALLIFSLIVLIHEFGHFLFARLNGVTVTEFSIGMGPRICSMVKGGTRYSIKIFPIGGSCMMLGEDEKLEEEGAFNKKGVWARISVIAAGPAFNFVLAFVLAIFIVISIGYDPATIAVVDSNSAAEQAGLEAGDQITEINGTNINLQREISTYFQFEPIQGDAIDVTVQRDGEEFHKTLTPLSVERYILGFSYSITESLPIISGVAEGGPLQRAGVQAGDVITAMTGNKISSGEELNEYLGAYPLNENPVELTYSRDGKETTVTVAPIYQGTAYVLGIHYVGRVKTNLVGVLRYSAAEVKYWIVTTVKSLGQMIGGKVSRDDISGPVAIVGMIGETYEESKAEGLLTVLLNMAYISILLSANLGVMNLLPIPALDGGRLVFLILELIRRKPINQEKEGMVHFIGLMALFALMILIFFNDISKLF